MKHRPVLLAGLVAGVTALAATAPPVLSDNNRGSGWHRDGGRSGDNSNRSGSRNEGRVIGGATAGQTNHGSGPASGSTPGRSFNTSPFMNRPGGPGFTRPPMNYPGGTYPNGTTAGPGTYGSDGPLTSPYRRNRGNVPGVTYAPGTPTIVTGSPGGATLTPRQYGTGAGDTPRNWRRYGANGPSDGFHRRPGSFRNDTGVTNGSPPTFGQAGGIDGNGVTIPGRVIGTNRPVDQYGRTATGRALNSPVYSSPRVGVSPRTDRVRPNPIFWYNPLNGRYERRDGRGHDGHDWDHRPHRGRRGNTDVLIGTWSPRPGYAFRWGGATHYFFYPYYTNYVTLDPLGYGTSVFPSPYYYYGYLPQYLPSTRVVIENNPVYVEPDENEDAGDADAYYLNRHVEQDVQTAMEDIRNAWLTSDIDLLLRHVRSEQDLGVFLKGKYVYSLPSADYRDLTQDAMKTSETLSFKWLDVDRKSDDEAVLKAEHVFKDRDGEKHTVFVSFTLLNENGAWWIAEVGSSDRKDTL